jgi:Septum formation initiator.
MLVYIQKRDIVELENQKAILIDEKEQLENEIDLLNDEDYVTRYARENYVFTREGEQVSIIPSAGE